MISSVVTGGGPIKSPKNRVADRFYDRRVNRAAFNLRQQFGDYGAAEALSVRQGGFAVPQAVV
jgi:hypothetical protein